MASPMDQRRRTCAALLSLPRHGCFSGGASDFGFGSGAGSGADWRCSNRVFAWSLFAPHSHGSRSDAAAIER